MLLRGVLRLLKDTKLIYDYAVNIVIYPSEIVAEVGIKTTNEGNFCFIPVKIKKVNP